MSVKNTTNKQKIMILSKSIPATISSEKIENTGQIQTCSFKEIIIPPYNFKKTSKSYLSLHQYQLLQYIYKKLILVHYSTCNKPPISFSDFFKFAVKHTNNNINKK